MSGMGAWEKLAGRFEAGEPLACGYRIPEAPKVELAVMAVELLVRTDIVTASLIQHRQAPRHPPDTIRVLGRVRRPLITEAAALVGMEERPEQ